MTETTGRPAGTWPGLRLDPALTRIRATSFESKQIWVQTPALTPNTRVASVHLLPRLALWLLTYKTTGEAYLPGSQGGGHEGDNAKCLA